MNILTKFKISFRSRMSILMIGMVLAVLSLFYTNRLADVLRQKEQNDVTLWVAAMERVSSDAFGNYRTDPLISHIVSTQNNILFIITDENLNVISSHLYPTTKSIRRNDCAVRSIRLPAPIPRSLSASGGQTTITIASSTDSHDCLSLYTTSHIFRFWSSSSSA